MYNADHVKRVKVKASQNLSHLDQSADIEETAVPYLLKAILTPIQVMRVALYPIQMLKIELLRSSNASSNFSSLLPMSF